MSRREGSERNRRWARAALDRRNRGCSVGLSSGIEINPALQCERLHPLKVNGGLSPLSMSIVIWPYLPERSTAKIFVGHQRAAAIHPNPADLAARRTEPVRIFDT